MANGAASRGPARLLAACCTRVCCELQWDLACVRGPHASPGAMHRSELGRCNVMLMFFICSCRNKNRSRAPHTFRKVYGVIPERTALCVRARACERVRARPESPPSWCPFCRCKKLCRSCACCILLLCNRGSVRRGQMASCRVACGRGMGKGLRCRHRCGEKWPHVGRLRPFPVSANHGRFDARPRVFSAHVFWCVFSGTLRDASPASFRGAFTDKFASAEGPMFFFLAVSVSVSCA
jgi:hypothetical protein